MSHLIAHITRYFTMNLKILALIFLMLPAAFPVFSQDTDLPDEFDSFFDGFENFSSFAADVLEDKILDNLTNVESGKKRFDSFVKKQLLDAGKTGLIGEEISEGMALILNDIWLDVKQRPRRGVCEHAAGGLAEWTAMQTKDLRTLRGAGRIWFDLLTSAIPGAPGLTKKLVETPTRAAYDFTRKQLEDLLKEWWNADKPGEIFEWSRQTGNCTVAIRVVWNKQKSAYLYQISGDCGCTMVRTPGLDRPPASILLDSFLVVGGGNVRINLDLADPNNPKERLTIQRLHYKMQADCDCRKEDESKENGGVSPEPAPVRLSEMGIMTGIERAKCPACEPLLEEVNAFVQEFNRLSGRMNHLADEISSEPYDTPERNQLLQDWHALKAQSEEVEVKHNEAFLRLYQCEITECTLAEEALNQHGVSSDGILRFEQVSTRTGRYSGCEECDSIAKSINELVNIYNHLVHEMNAIARDSYNSSLGTTEGNHTYRNWIQRKEQLDELDDQIRQQDAELSACKAMHCAGSRWEHFIMLSKLSGACTPCKDLESQINNITDRLNDLARQLNEIMDLERAHVLEFGDAMGTDGEEALIDLLESHNRRGLLQEHGELLRERERLWYLLQECIYTRCTGKYDPESDTFTFSDPDEFPEPNTEIEFPDIIWGGEVTTTSIPVLYTGRKIEEQPESDPEPDDETEEELESDDETKDESEPEESPETETEEVTDREYEGLELTGRKRFTDRLSINRDWQWDYLKTGAKLDVATRGAFKDAVCDQQELTSCDVSGFSPLGMGFIEMPVLDYAIGGINIPINAGLGFTWSRVVSTQNFAYGVFSPYPYQVKGETDVITAEAYISVENFLQDMFGLSHYLRLGLAHIWNNGSFDLMPLGTAMGDGTSYDRKHRGLGFVGGLGVDIPIGGRWGTRINADYMGLSGADNSFRLGIGITYDIGQSGNTIMRAAY